MDLEIKYMNYLAQDFGSIQSDAGLSTVITNSKPLQIIASGLPYVLSAGIILLLNIISSGLKMMTSKGDPKALRCSSKTHNICNRYSYTFVSFWLVQIIMKFLGVNTIFL